MATDVHAPRRSRATKTAETTATIVDATIVLLGEVGEQGLRVADVQQRTGISIGSIYHHFGDRDGLIKAARARQFRETRPTYGDEIARLAASASSAQEFLSRLTELIRAVQSREEIQKRMQRIVYIASAASRPDLRSDVTAEHTDVVDTSTQIAQLLIDRGWVKPNVSARALATYSLAMELGSIIVDLDNDGVGEDEWCRVVQLATEGLFVGDGRGEPEDRAPTAQPGRRRPSGRAAGR